MRTELKQGRGNRRLTSAFVALGAVLAMVMAACGGGSSEPDTQATGTATGTGETTDESADAGQLEPLQISMAGLGNLIHAPVYVALEGGFFEEEGFDVSLVGAGGGSNAAAVVVSGEAPVGAMVIDHTLRLADQGQAMPVAVPLTLRFAQQFVVARDIVEERGVDVDAPIEEKFAKLDGISVGITSPGSSTDNATRYLFEQAGLDPDAAVEIVPLGSTSQAATAFAQGDVDAFSASPPYAQAQTGENGRGVIVADFLAGEVEALSNVIYTTVVMNKQWAEENHDDAVAITRAILKALRLMDEEPKEAQDLIYDEWYAENVERDVFETGWDAVAPAYVTPETATLDEDIFQQTVQYFLEDVQGKEYTWSYEDVAVPAVLDDARASLDG